MKILKEPLNIDFYTTGQQMTDEDQKRVSDFIKGQKEKKSKSRRRRTISSKPNTAVAK
jgi:hypothetical protein